jgi:3-oxoacyl-[acyl-carrier protein] reductase
MDLGPNGRVGAMTGGSVGIGLASADGLAAEDVNLAPAARGAECVREEEFLASADSDTVVAQTLNAMAAPG